MKKLIFILLLAFASCEKEQPTTNCKTCTVTCTYVQYGVSSNTFEVSETEYCNGTWTSAKPPVNVSGTGGGVHWSKTYKMDCK